MLEPLRPAAILVGRIVLGVIFVAHGIQKFSNGISVTTQGFESMGVPLPGLAAPGVAVLETIGGLALIAGALLPVVGTLLAIDMVGALVLVHLPNGFFAANGGFEYVLALAGFSLVIGFSGGGLFATDKLWQHKFTRQAEDAAVS